MNIYSIFIIILEWFIVCKKDYRDKSTKRYAADIPYPLYPITKAFLGDLSITIKNIINVPMIRACKLLLVILYVWNNRFSFTELLNFFREKFASIQKRDYLVAYKMITITRKKYNLWSKQHHNTAYQENTRIKNFPAFKMIFHPLNSRHLVLW